MGKKRRRLPDCYNCRFNGRGHPCRRADGSLDYPEIARAIVAAGRLFTADGLTDEKAYRELRWATDCEFEIEQQHPEHTFSLVIAAIDACETLEDAAYIAAGLLENMVVKHGASHIGRIEALARRSPKFRYVLSGIWSQSGSVDPEVWARIGQAVATGGRMSNDARGPWDGQPVTVLTDEEALALMKERLSDSAKDILVG